MKMRTSNTKINRPKNAGKVKPVICYPDDTLPGISFAELEMARKDAKKVNEVIVNPREAACFTVSKGSFFRIKSIEGPQVGDLNLWNAENLTERFYSGKTRALHGTHLSRGDHMWSVFPFLHPMATIYADTLSWYGYDEDGAGVHDVIGTRCDPYTHHLLTGEDYHHCCHSNLTNALAKQLSISKSEAETHVHDVLNVFMCTGFTRDKHQYFMKASPVRPGDYLELFAHQNLLGGLSACPGGDCGSEHSSDMARCFPLLVEIFEPVNEIRNVWPELRSSTYKHP